MGLRSQPLPTLLIQRTFHCRVFWRRFPPAGYTARGAGFPSTKSARKNQPCVPAVPGTSAFQNGEPGSGVQPPIFTPPVRTALPGWAARMASPLSRAFRERVRSRK